MLWGIAIGSNAWPRDSYMNFWSCNLGGGLLGYAQFPGGPAATDGVVMLYSTVGSISSPGTASPYNLGRTATHEVGHWLNLRHIWGDANCGNDLVADTPTQQTDNGGCPSFPHVTCSNGPNGDMFMNYMDYVNDAAMFMFTRDQATRMNAALSVSRPGILASDGLVPVAGVVPDIWMQDNADDTGAEPDPSPNPMWISDDIWVRNGSDGLTNQDHENPRGGQPNHVYVRVRNRGCSASTSLSTRSTPTAGQAPTGFQCFEVFSFFLASSEANSRTWPQL